MKKLLFTALAVVVFSGVAMAKTGEVKDNEIKDLKIENNVIADPCKDEQDAAVTECLANGCSKDEAFYFGAIAWGNCMKEVGIKSF